MSDYTCFSKVGLKIELERIEALLRRALISGAIALAGFAGPIVANEAAGAALAALPDGKEVFVLSHRSIWTKRNGVPGTQGVPPLAAHEVIATTDGTGVLVRTNYSDPSLRIGINDLYIDPLAPGSNDENNGLTPATALRTGRELFRRWGWGSQVEVGPNLATSVDGFLTIHVLSDLLAPDSLAMNVFVTVNAALRVRGGAPTVLRTAVFTAPAVAMAGAANTRLRLTDAALVTWAPYFARNIRGRITVSAVALGGTFQPQQDVPAGPGSVDCSGCQQTNEFPAFSQVPVTVTPAVGDTYVIEQLVTVNIDPLFVFDSQLSPVGNVFVNLVDIHLPSLGTQLDTGPIARGGVWLNFYQCTISRSIQCDSMGTGSTFVASYFTEAPFNHGGGVTIAGGGALRLAVTVNPYIGWEGAFIGTIDNDFVSDGMPILIIGDSSLANCAVWNAFGGAGNPGSHGFLVGSVNARGRCNFTATAWGNGSPGVGVRVGAGCVAVGAPQVVTGVSGDLALASQVGAGATCVWWEVATSLYKPIPGIGLTWAALIAAKGAAGFGLSAHWPDQDAHWTAKEVN